MSIAVSRILIFLLALITGQSLLPAADELSETQKQHLIDVVGKRLVKKAYAFETDFSTWPELVEAQSDEIAAAGTKKELATVLRAALESYDLSHLGIFSPESVKLHRKGKRTGIGITIHPLDAGGGLISYVLANSPAATCGLQKGDILTHIDDVAITDISQLSGELGQKRTIEWQRGSDTLSCLIEYAPFKISEPSKMYWPREDVAVIQIQSFQYRYYKAGRINRFFREAKNAKAIILDLRNNRGGLSFYSRHLASKLSPSNSTFALLARKKHEDGTKERKKVHPLPFSKPFKGRVIVLTDSLSASAADLVPAFVSESGRGIVIGQQTSGSLQLARTFPLPYGFRIYLPIAELLTPSGERLEHTGFKPDIELTLNQTIDDDFIMKRALQAIDQESARPE